MSDEAFREAFGTEEQCRGAVRATNRVLLDAGIARGRAGGSISPLQEADIAQAGTGHARLPLTLWFASEIEAKNGVWSVELAAGSGSDSRLHGGDGPTQGELRLGGRVRWTTPQFRQASGKRARPAPSCRRSRPAPRGARVKREASTGRGFRKRRDRIRGFWLPDRRDRRRLEGARRGSVQPSGIATRGSGLVRVNTTLGNIKSAITGTYRKLATMPNAPRQLRLALQPPLPPPDHDPALRP